MRDLVIRRVEPLSVGKVLAIVYAIFGLIPGVLFSFFSITVGALASQSNFDRFFGFFGAASIVILPVFYGIMGFIGGVIGALIYNLAAKIVGGIRIETK